jgi:HK97 family phage major capsid protein
MSARLKELREKNARTVTAAREALNGITDQTTPERRAELERQFDDAMKEFDRIEADIAREERAARAEAVTTEREERERREAEEARRRGRPAPDVVAPGAAQPEKAELRTAFKNLLLGGASYITEEERAALEEAGAMPAAMSREMRAMAAGTGSAGGFTVPRIFLPKITETMKAWGPMLDPGAIDLLETDGGNLIEWPSLDDTDKEGSQFAENAEITDDGGQDAVFGQLTLSAYMHNSEIIRVPLQLMEDSAFDIENRLMTPLFGKRMARTANRKLTTGTGSSQPQGIAVGAGAGVTAAAVAAIAADELFDLQHSVDPAYRQSPTCGWMFHDDTLKMIRKLKDAENRYIWQPGLTSGEPGTILGNRYYVNQAMAVPGASNRSVIFGDLKNYIVRRVGNFSIFVFRERYMNNTQLGFMAFGRFDGKVTDSTSIKGLTHPAS